MRRLKTVVLLLGAQIKRSSSDFLLLRPLDAAFAPEASKEEK